jgi:2-keto-4-pentenoate hydratase/2-oxohepta-3-ene-1,7-dioic acid hydratase in catechol pathway
MERPKDQTWFSMPPTAANGPFDPIALPRVSDQLDYEAELVVVIGKSCRYADKSAAAGAIFGYCVGNDVSVRDWQFRTTQFVLGKSFDTHAPHGPWIVTADEIDPLTLDIECQVNGEVRQKSNTRHMIFDPVSQVEHLSQAMTLEPGDLLFTGTPDGVGAVRKPPLWLKAGDSVRTTISGIGSIENHVLAD